MVAVQYLVFTHSDSQTALKSEAGKTGAATLEMQSGGAGTIIRVTGFVQEEWQTSSAIDHLDIYIHQDELNALEQQVHGSIGQQPPQQFPAVNPRWTEGGHKALFYVFDRSEIQVDDVRVQLGAGLHGPAEFTAEVARLFVDREVPQRGRGFRARAHFGVFGGDFVRVVPSVQAPSDSIEIRMTGPQAAKFAAAIQYVIDQHRARNP